MLGDHEINEQFTYHRPTGDQPQRYEQLRAKAKELAFLIRDLCPATPERTEAINRLRESIMWANASIALSKPGEAVNPQTGV